MAVSLIYGIQILSQSDKEDNGFESSDWMGLIAPPVYALEGSTPPLDTSKIGFIAYYQRTVGWTLSNTVPAFINYTDGGNYYDGLVRVWDSGEIGALSSSYDRCIDVRVRVRADGWIIAWFDRFVDDPGAIVWWGHERDAQGSPPMYSTTLSRAIAIVFNVAGVGFPGYDIIGMFDYSEPSANRLVLFGQSSYYDSDYYYTIPVSSTIVPIRFLVRAGGQDRSTLSIDGGQIYSISEYGDWGWSTYVLNPGEYMTKGVQHSIRQDMQPSGSLSNVAFVMWTG